MTALPHHLSKVVYQRDAQSMNCSPQRVCLYPPPAHSAGLNWMWLPLRPPSVLFPKLAHLANQTSLWERWRCASPSGNDILSSLALSPIFYLLHRFLFATTLALSPFFSLQSSTSKAFSATTDLFLFPLICPSLPCALTQIGEGIVCQ